MALGIYHLLLGFCVLVLLVPGWVVWYLGTGIPYHLILVLQQSDCTIQLPPWPPSGIIIVVLVDFLILYFFKTFPLVYMPHVSAVVDMVLHLFCMENVPLKHQMPENNICTVQFLFFFFCFFFFFFFFAFATMLTFFQPFNKMIHFLTSFVVKLWINFKFLLCTYLALILIYLSPVLVSFYCITTNAQQLQSNAVWHS